MIEEFNVDSKAERVQLNLAHVARKIYKNKKLKQTNASADLVQYKFEIPENSPLLTYLLTYFTYLKSMKTSARSLSFSCVVTKI